MLSNTEEDCLRSSLKRAVDGRRLLVGLGADDRRTFCKFEIICLKCVRTLKYRQVRWITRAAFSRCSLGSTTTM